MPEQGCCPGVKVGVHVGIEECDEIGVDERPGGVAGSRGSTVLIETYRRCVEWGSGSVDDDPTVGASRPTELWGDDGDVAVRVPGASVPGVTVGDRVDRSGIEESGGERRRPDRFAPLEALGHLFAGGRHSKQTQWRAGDDGAT